MFSTEIKVMNFGNVIIDNGKTYTAYTLKFPINLYSEISYLKYSFSHPSESSLAFAFL